MATTESQEFGCDMNESLSSDHRESEIPTSRRKKGGWITFPFVIGSLAGLSIGGGGVIANLIVYLIREFHVKSIDAAQISNVINGCLGFFPVIAAIMADSFLGSFSVITISSCITVLGTAVLVLTATLDSLRPPTCEDRPSSPCEAPSRLQLALLYGAVAVASIGMGGARFTIATMGANQFEKREDRAVFFNWFFFALYAAVVTSSTAVVYVQDNVGWGLGFGICAAASFFGLLLFLAGKRFYRGDKDKPRASPFAGLARVVVACMRKRKVVISSTTSEDYYFGDTNTKPSNTFRFLNKAAVKTEGDLTDEGKISKPWKLCTVQQVEDLKALLRILPLWLSVLFLSTPIAIQASLTTLQALAMDRHVGPHFQIPAGSILVVTLITTAAFLAAVDRLLLPAWQTLTRGHSPSALQRIGLGHALNILSMAVSALVESKRLKIAHQNPNAKVVPMLALWLFPQLVLVGLGEAFHFPGQVSLYYQEFPASLRNTATAMVSMVIGICYYLSTAVVGLVRRTTAWLPDDINAGRLDNVYWLVTMLGVLNFGYYLVCAKLYKYQHSVGHNKVVEPNPE